MGTKNPQLNVAVPTLIAALYVADVAIVALYIANVVFRHAKPGKLTWFLNINQEGNLPTWYATVQLFFLAIVLGVFVYHQFQWQHARSWLLLALPCIFVLLSLDESAQIHEYLGKRSDALLPDASRYGTAIQHTGIWMFVVGIPFAIVMAAVLYLVRPYFTRSPKALAKFCAGCVIMLGGAAGIEFLANFAEIGTPLHFTQVCIEELAELVGATTMIWATLDLLLAHRFTWQIDAASPADLT